MFWHQRHSVCNRKGKHFLHLACKSLCVHINNNAFEYLPKETLLSAPSMRTNLRRHKHGWNVLGFFMNWGPCHGWNFISKYTVSPF